MKQPSREMFEQQRQPRFGTSNPEHMRMPLWEWMIRSSLGPYQARQLFEATSSCQDGPVWTFDRMGASRTELPDGRTICVGGEHEDFYDPDFNIYNDVVVLRQPGEIEIYGYPNGVFPPTDYHTATLAGDQLVLIGSVGYQDERKFGTTPVYRLDLKCYRIDKIQTSGEMPGWISRHKAECSSEGFIKVWGGRVFEAEKLYIRNLEEFDLDLRTRTWRRLTNRKWSQFAVCQEDGKCFAVQPRMLSVEDLVPRKFERAAVQPEEYRALRIMMSGIPVLIEIRVSSIEVVVEGSMADETYAQLREAIRANAEALLKTPCVLQA